MEIEFSLGLGMRWLAIGGVCAIPGRGLMGVVFVVGTGGGMGIPGVA